MKINYLQHVPFEDPGYLKKWAVNNNHDLVGTHIYKDDNFMEIDHFDAFVIMGGPMSTYDQYEWLSREKDFIAQVILSGKKIIGICLGAQLIADVLGAKVYPNKYKEIGWFNINITECGKKTKIFQKLPETINAFHWHGDTFDIPGGAKSIIESDACKNQGFIFDNRILGFQFHLEIQEQGVDNLLNNCSNELVPGKFIQNRELIKQDTEKNIKTANDFMEKILNNFFNG